MADALKPDIQEKTVDSVLLIDGDNDPHLPPDFPITPRTLVRVFVRVGAKTPRGLERRLGELPLSVTVSSPKPGANAEDFVMSLHAGILHATLPMHIPFTLVTHDKSLAVMAQELQRVGRRAELWTSHPERGARRPPAAAVRKPASRGRRAPSRPVPSSATPAAPVAVSAAPPSGRGLPQIAAAYAARLSRIKDPPSRLKTLLNDIKNRAGTSGFSPEAILEELKSAQTLTVDANGRVMLKGR